MSRHMYVIWRGFFKTSAFAALILVTFREDLLPRPQ